MTTNVRASGDRVLFEGQSLNLTPEGDTYPQQLMAGRGVSWQTTAVGGAPMATLKGDVARRVGPWATAAERCTMVVLGAETDLALGASAAGIYSSFVTHSANAKAAGVDLVVGCTVPQWPPLNGGWEATRVTLNGLIVADASNAFDAVADLAADSRLDDVTDTTYFFLGHFTSAGAAAAADVVDPVLVSLGVLT